MKKEKLTIQNFLTPEETVKINELIAGAEKTTAGEIKLLVVRKSTWMSLSSLKMRIAAARKRAKREFLELGLQHARKGTGILIMISLKERVVVVESGKAFEGKLSQDTWERLRDMIINGIASGKRIEGICSAIGEAGRILTEHFPAGPDDSDEISNEIVFKD
jgi:putative membrane protein